MRKRMISPEINKINLKTRSKIGLRDRHCKKCNKPAIFIKYYDSRKTFYLLPFEETKYGTLIAFEVDHIYPKIKGGKTVESNLQLLCRKCNRGKGGR